MKYVGMLDRRRTMMAWRKQYRGRDEGIHPEIMAERRALALPLLKSGVARYSDARVVGAYMKFKCDNRAERGASRALSYPRKRVQRRRFDSARVAAAALTVSSLV